jgi:hypothetical protein
VAYPYIFESTFDAGTLDSWSSETDSSSIFDYPHYAELARQGFAPWAGAHCARARLSGTAVGYLTHTSAFDLSASGTISAWFTICVGEDLFLNDTDTIILYSLLASATNESVFGIRNNGGVYEFFAGETGATRTMTIVPNNKKWYQIEVVSVIDSGVGNDGTLAVYVDGFLLGAAVTALDQGAITDGRFGVISGTASGDRGTILFGGLIADDLRIYPRKRFATEKWITHDITAFVGHFWLDSASITGTSTDAILTCYDTDIFESTAVSFSRSPKVYIRNVTANDQSPGMTTPVEFTKGCYAVLAGTAPQAFLSLRNALNQTVVQSGANYVDAGRARKAFI